MGKTQIDACTLRRLEIALREETEAVGQVYNPDPFTRAIGRLYSNPTISAEQIVEARFELEVGGEFTVEELLVAGRYESIGDSLRGDDNLGHIKRRPAGSKVRMEFFHPRGETMKEILEEAGAKGLQRPSREDVLFFGAEYPDIQESCQLAFFTDPLNAHRTTGAQNESLELTGLLLGMTEQWYSSHRKETVRVVRDFMVVIWFGERAIAVGAEDIKRYIDNRTKFPKDWYCGFIRQD